jgi:hypothetical protein
MYKDAQSLIKNLRRQKPRKDKKGSSEKSTLTQKADCLEETLPHWQRQ